MFILVCYKNETVACFQSVPQVAEFLDKFQSKVHSYNKLR